MKKFLMLFFSAMAMPLIVFAAQTPNSRGGAGDVSARKDSAVTIRKNASSDYVSRAAVSDRGAVSLPRGNALNRAATNATVSRSASSAATAGQRGVVASGAARAALPVNSARSAATMVSGATVGRSAVTQSRAGAARAAAVFNDISKMGGGYAACRETYNTCMDQFCANKSDVFRRCICSERFKDFNDLEDKLDRAKNMLQNFADTYLEAVELSSAEAGAMYSATAGEKAVKKSDSTAAGKMLTQIENLLSGKSEPTQKKTTLDFSSLNFGTAMDDIWGGSDSDNWMLGGGNNTANMEGQALFNSVNRQCAELAKSSCESENVIQMVRSAYSILISNDCSSYEKKINSTKEQVAQKVREANSVLRAARLQEYRDHNSASINECVAKVRADVMDEYACGPEWKRCLDFTGRYINPTTGEPVFTPVLFELASQIELSSTIGENRSATGTSNFLQELDKFKNRATASLDSCRDDADTVWSIFKDQALIEIAQAQDRKIEEVKESCVETMKICYDKQSGALKSFDDTTAQAAGAMSARAAKAMCADKVSACASLYGNGSENCAFDASNGKLADATSCGPAVSALLNFVNAVDNVKIQEGCEVALKNYATEICTPAVSGQKFPFQCRLMKLGAKTDGKGASTVTNTLYAALNIRADTYCNETRGTFEANTEVLIDKIANEVRDVLRNMLADECDKVSGLWQDDIPTGSPAPEAEKMFIGNVFGGNADQSENWGFCEKNSVLAQCNIMEGTYNSANQTCNFDEEWYNARCTGHLSGVMENGVCYVVEE
ncbi:MAG: hypothetical protein LBK26_01315 [Rickettsiales bacterium]|jgi:hypothetical protein|nr:hypothetical protein [Rickettsiales bacterium]